MSFKASEDSFHLRFVTASSLGVINFLMVTADAQLVGGQLTVLDSQMSSRRS